MVKAHAKINLALNVNEKLENGYHDIDTIMVPLELHDRIEFDFLPEGFDSMVTCDDVSLPTDESNLTVKALQTIIEHFNIKKKFRIHVHKAIPISAGLGGGSADAACVINTVLKMCKINPSKEELVKVAKQVGADVPFCLFNKPSRCKGIGEELEPIQIKNKYYVLLVKPKKGISTEEAYKRYDLYSEKEHANIDELVLALKNGNDKAISKNLINSLEKPAIEAIEEINMIKQKLMDDGFDKVMMSGSGSSVFALSTSLKDIQKEALKFDLKKYYVKVTNIL